MTRNICIASILILCLLFSSCSYVESDIGDGIVNTFLVSPEVTPTLETTVTPTIEPTPTPSPTEKATDEASEKPTNAKTLEPTSRATVKPSIKPTVKPTLKPTKKPTPTPEPTPNTVKVLIPEGFSVSQIGDRLEANGVCKKSEFLKMINEYDFSYYPLVSKIPNNPKRVYKLEGYLWPDTYEFYKNMKPQDVIGKMLRAAERNIGEKYSYPDMTTDEIIILASIIEREADNPDDMRKVSSVFHNRLKTGQRLEADATIVYVEKFVKPNLTGDKNKYNEYYNTYKTSALPAGAICNPGRNALYAAVNPADTNYYYFLTDNKGNYYYAETFEEHRKNREITGV